MSNTLAKSKRCRFSGFTKCFLFDASSFTLISQLDAFCGDRMTKTVRFEREKPNEELKKFLLLFSFGRSGNRPGKRRRFGVTEERHVEHTWRKRKRSKEVSRRLAIRPRRSFGSCDQSAMRRVSFLSIFIYLFFSRKSEGNFEGKVIEMKNGKSNCVCMTLL